MTEIRTIQELLVNTLSSADPRPLRGSQLSVLVKSAYPDFRAEVYGTRTLRDLIRKNIPEIVEFGKAGMDILYQLRATNERENSEGKEQDAIVAQLMNNSRLWKTFASPDSPFNLYLIPETNEVRVLHPSSRPLPTWRELPKISPRVLLQIGLDFAAPLGENQRAILDPILKEPKWWIPFFERLQSLGLKSKWVEFRRHRIRAEFVRIVNESSSLKMPALQADNAPPQLTEQQPRIQQLDPIRKIAVEVILKMTESELRTLNLPLGYVMDSLVAQ